MCEESTPGRAIFHDFIIFFLKVLFQKVREYSLSSLSDNGEANVLYLRTEGGIYDGLGANVSDILGNRVAIFLR